MADYLLNHTWFIPVDFTTASANTNNGVNNNNNVNNNGNVNNNSNNVNNNNASNVNNNANTNDVTAPASDDYKTQFNTKLGLIKKYCSEYIVLDENKEKIDVEAIRKKYANKPEEGVKYCEELIKSFDQDKVKKMVKTEYTKRVNANKENGEKVANEWVKKILESGLEAAKINTNNVNAGNVLDVIGAFVTNEDVKNGKVSLSQLFEDPKSAENLVSALKAKAESFIDRTDLDDSVKETITAQANELTDAKYEYITSDTDKLKSNRTTLVNKFMTLFETIRTEQAKLNDKAAPQYYGLPADSTITLSNETNRANEEIKAHKGRKKLNTNI